MDTSRRLQLQHTLQWNAFKYAEAVRQEPALKAALDTAKRGQADALKRRDFDAAFEWLRTVRDAA